MNNLSIALVITLIYSSHCFGQTAEDYFLKGVDKGKKEDYRGAVADYTKAIEINPKYAMAYNNRAFIEIFRGNYANAIEDFSMAIELDPTNYNYYIARGSCREQTKALNGALGDFTKAIELKPNLHNAYQKRGILKILMGQLDSGCADLSMAGELGSESVYDWIKEYCN